MNKPKNKTQSRASFGNMKQLIVIAGVVIALTGGYLALHAKVGVHQGSKSSLAQDPKVVAERLARIAAIYDTLKLGPDYQVTSVNIFGDKRSYDYDAGRSYSSSKQYIHNAGVKETAAQLKTAIEAAGFKYFDEPYPGSTEIQYHYKSAKNEYIRATVTSQPRDAAFRRDKKPTQADFALDPMAGPTSVIIKVNLDDNNE